MAAPTSFPPRLTAVTIDCADPGRLADFWSALLEVEVEDRDEEVVALAAQPGMGVGVHFRRVPEPKRGKNRVHLDFVVKDPEASRAQVTGLGGQILERMEEDTWIWWIIADPEGNEACLVQSTPDRRLAVRSPTSPRPLGHPTTPPAMWWATCAVQVAGRADHGRASRPRHP